MAFKMKGSSLYGSPLTQKKDGKRKKTIVSEDTDIIKTDKKGKNYSLAMYDNDKGVNRGDTLFVNQNNPKVRQTTAGRNSSDYYIEGAQDLKLKETKDSKTRKGKTPKSYNITGTKR